VSIFPNAFISNSKIIQGHHLAGTSPITNTMPPRAARRRQRRVAVGDWWS